MTRKKCHYLKRTLSLGFLLLGIASLFASPHRIHLHRIDVTRLPDVHIYFTVIDTHGDCVLGLTDKEMDLFIDEAAQGITSVESALEGQEYLAVALLFDRSGSVKSALDQAKAAARDFVKRLSLNDQVAIISFDDHVRMDAGFSRGRLQVKEAIAGIQVGRDTALFDAMDKALDLMQQASTNRQAIVVLSDGKDTKSLKSQQAVMARAKRDGVPIFTIGIGRDQDRKDLKDISVGTGGVFFAAGGPEDLVRLYQTIGEQLQNQYHLSFTSTAGIDEQWHNLKLRVRDPGGQVIETEREYIATKGIGIKRQTVTESLQHIQREKLLLVLAVGALLGLVLGLVVLVILKLARPRLSLRPTLCLGLVFSAIFLGAVISVLIYFMK